ncbi:MAG: DMT family transporter [Alphaproteobacteria bacterium]|nr:DMT family transporter [Alphaproteobacteria bacterium]
MYFFKKGNIYGACLIVFVAVVTTLSNTLTHLLPKDFPTEEILFFKVSIGLCLITLFHIRDLKTLTQTNMLHWQALKGFAGAIGNWFWIASIQVLPLADATALSLTSAFLTTIGAAYFFFERINRWVLLAVTMGFAGVFLILCPSAMVFSIYAFFPLFSAVSLSVSSLIIKRVSLKDSSDTTVFYLMLFMTLFSVGPAFWNWQAPAINQLMMLIMIGGLYTVGQFALIEAYTHATAGFVAPFKFTRFPLAILSGFFFFGEHITWKTALGGSLIIVSYYTVIKAKSLPAYFYTKSNSAAV